MVPLPRKMPNRIVVIAAIFAVMTYVQQVSGQSPEFAAHVNRGIQLAQSGQYGPALIELNAAVRMDPNNPRGYLNRGSVFRDIRNFDYAISDYTKAIDIASQDTEAKARAYFLRGQIYFNVTKQYDKAIGDFDESLRLNPSDPEAISSRQIAQQHVAQSGEPTSNPPTAQATSPPQPGLWDRFRNAVTNETPGKRIVAAMELIRDGKSKKLQNYIVARARPGAEMFSAMMASAFAEKGGVSRFEIASEQISGDIAEVRICWYYKRGGNGCETFPLEREDGEWRIHL